MVAHGFNPSNQETEAGESMGVQGQPEFKENSRTARAVIKRKAVLKNKTSKRVNTED